MRQLRNASEYLSLDRTTASADHLVRARQISADLIDKSRHLLDAMPVF